MKKSFGNQSNSYPIVKIPETILEYLGNQIGEETIAKHLGVSKPKLILPPAPQFPDEYRTHDSVGYELDFDGGCTVILFFIFLMPVGFAIGDTWITKILFGLLIGALEILILQIVGHGLFKERHNLTKVKIPESEMNHLIMEYESKKSEYDKRVSVIKSKYFDDSNKFQNLIKSKKKKVKDELLTLALKPHIYAERGEISPRRGAIELRFLSKLLVEFPGMIKVDFVPKVNSNSNKRTYNPDFTMVCPNTSLHIDIEIDEPYTLLEKKPIHYIGCEDLKRDDFFLDNNWCIIRFSEKQIIEDLDECLTLIKTVYSNILQGKDSYIDKLNPDNFWTYEQSLILASDNFRENYLSKNI